MRRKKAEFEEKTAGIRGLLDEAESEPAKKESLPKNRRSGRDEDDDLDLDGAWNRA